MKRLLLLLFLLISLNGLTQTIRYCNSDSITKWGQVGNIGTIVFTDHPAYKVLHNNQEYIDTSCQYRWQGKKLVGDTIFRREMIDSIKCLIYHFNEKNQLVRIPTVKVTKRLITVRCHLYRNQETNEYCFGLKKEILEDKLTTKFLFSQ